MSIGITEVLPGSIAESLGLKTGDRLVSINGRSISDELEFRFHAAEGLLELVVERTGQGNLQGSAILEDGQQLGISVADFRAKACNNKCVFCFVDQLPRGVRRTLRFKDDDYRLSFLHGNYLTLTNLSEKEITRIIEQRLSPLYVSVHATEMPVRAVMLGRSEEHCSLDPMLRLIEGGITIHAQVVLCPGINGGVHLERTITDLSRHFPGLVSVAIVPLGTSRYRGNLPTLREATPEYCREVIQQLESYQRRFKDELGVTFAYLADEFYLQAGKTLPDSSYYDEFALLEDGVGMVRYFDNEFRRNLRKRRKMPDGSPDGTLVTGKLFHPWLCRYARKLEKRFGGRLRAVCVENEFMGPKITVAGLLSGGDIAAALKGRELGQFVIVPGQCLSRDSKLFLDDLSLTDLEKEVEVPVRETFRTVDGFFSALCNVPYDAPKVPIQPKYYPHAG